MREAAREMDFERAAKLRDEVSALSHVRDRQQATIASEDSFDAVGAFAEGESACVQVFAVRDGQIVNRDSFLLDNYGESRAEDVALQFVPQYYGTAAVPREVLLQSDDRQDELATLAAHLSDCVDARVEVRRPRRGDKRRILEMAVRNAEARSGARAGAGGGAAQQGRLDAGRAAGGARAAQAARPDRVLRHLQHDGDQLRGLDGRLPGRPTGQGRVPAVQDPDRRGRRRLREHGRGHQAPPRKTEGGRREVPAGARPDPARRRQGTALSRDACLRGAWRRLGSTGYPRCAPSPSATKRSSSRAGPSR